MAAKNGLEKKKNRDKSSGTSTLVDLKKQLLDSVAQCKPKIVKRLMDARVDPNCTNELGETPLIIACQLEDGDARRKIASLLLKSSACVNSQDISGNTPMSNAVKKVDEHLAEALLEKGADVSLTTGDGNNILCCAAACGSVRITKLVLKEVLKQKLPVDHKNMHGITPLLLAAQSGHIDVARILVKEGKASVTIRDLDNFMTAEQWMRHVGFYTAQEIAFLSPKSRHKRKTAARSLLDSVVELESESSPDIFGIEKVRHTSSKQQPAPLSLPHIPSQALSSRQNDSTRSMFELPSVSTSSLPKLDSKFKTEHIPAARVSQHDIFSSSYLNKRKSIVEHNKKSKFYAKGSLEPLSTPLAPPPAPPSLKRMNSVVTKDEMDIGDFKKQHTKLPPLNK